MVPNMATPGASASLCLDYPYISAMKAILLIDHGSKREEANEMLACVRGMVQEQAGPDVLVGYAHMELAEPTIAQGIAECVKRGATEVVAFPYMLSPGKHSTRDIPRMIDEAAKAFPDVKFSVTPAFGVHEKLGEVVLERAGERVSAASSAGPASRS
jgi:sirohydrochlorin ferrochelatase